MARLQGLPLVVGEFGLVADPEARFSASGTMWVTVRLVAKSRKRDQSGQWVDGDPCFIDMVAFGKVAENFAESVLKHYEQNPDAVAPKVGLQRGRVVHQAGLG